MCKGKNLSIRVNKCYLCDNEDFDIVHEGVRDNQDINVLKCLKCGLVQLDTHKENDYEFYENSGMRKYGDTDFRSVRITAMADDERRFNMFKSSLANKSVLDFGCGAGGFIHRADNICKFVDGIEPEKLMRDQLSKEGVTCFSSSEAAKRAKKKYDIITFFHVIEHLDDPISELGGVRDLLKDKGKIIIEVPNCDDALLSLYNSKAFADFTYWSCHLYLYSDRTLTVMVRRAGYKVNFIKQIQRYPLSNTLYWLSKGEPGGHVYWNMMNDMNLDKEYGELLSRLGCADTIVAEIEPS